MKLADNCILKSGFQGKTQDGGQYRQIKLKDVTKDGIIKYDELDGFNSEKVNKKYLLKKGDIILKAKSGDNTAALIEEDIENIVPSAHFIIITIKDADIFSSEYLTAYLNSEYAQDYFKKHAEGTALPIVKIKTLEDLDVRIPGKDKQKKIADMYKFIQDEKVTMDQIYENRKKQFTAFLRENLN